MDHKEQADANAYIVKKYVNSGEIGCIVPPDRGQIPVLYARGNSLAEAWEKSLLALWLWGRQMRTQYDRKDASGNFIDAPSLDCTMTTVITDPLSEPRIHKAFPGGLADIEEYRQEVVDGIKDHWIRNPNDPKDTRWEYTYHERMRKYSVPNEVKPKEIILQRNTYYDQFEIVAQTLAKSPESRRAQMVSWKVWQDNNISDPACWRSLWGRMVYDDRFNEWNLNLNMSFRSRDAYQAAFMNLFAFIDLGDRLAARIQEIRNEKVVLGRFVDESDSYHIYGKDLKDFEDRFLKHAADPNKLFSDRTWTMEYAQEIFDEVKPLIKKKIADYDRDNPRPFNGK